MSLPLKRASMTHPRERIITVSTSQNACEHQTFNKQLLRIKYVSGTEQGPGEAAKNRLLPAFVKLTVQWG